MSARADDTVVTRVDFERFGSVPRDVRLTGNGRAMTALAILLAIGAVVAALSLTIVRTRQQAAVELFQRDAVATSAEVTGIGPTRGEQRQRSVTFRYAVDGSAFTRTSTMSRGEWRDLTVGDPIHIRYLRSDPGRAWVGFREPDVMPIVIVPLLPIALIGAAGLVTWRVRRDWALLSEGRFAEGRVLGARKVARQHHRAYRIRYEFQTLSGATVTTESETGRKPPEAGTVVPIVYHREDPRRSALYPLSLVRPVKG